MKNTRSVRTNDTGELFEWANHMSAFIRLKVFNFNTMDSAHCIYIEKNDFEKYPQKYGADSEKRRNEENELWNVKSICLK